MPDLFEASYSFDISAPERSIIKVIGVGGGGSNAVTFMFNQGIKDVEFVVVNTDIQALKNCSVTTRLQIGTALTEGLGAGANPEKGRDAALESEDEIRKILGDGTKMVFVTAGMGGGTGTGAAPVIAKIAKDMGILTVGIVTAPFSWEGPKKRKQAEEGIEELKRNCDTVLVILNDKLREMFGNLRMSEAFAEADNILATGARSIAEIITVPGVINVDFEDVKTVMRMAGTAVMGSAQVKGDNRARKGAEEALSSPLLNSRDITGAERILISLSSSREHETRMDEIEEIMEYVQGQAGNSANIIYGHSIDESLGEYQRVTVIATSFDRPQDAIDRQYERPQVYELDRSTASNPVLLSTAPAQNLHFGPTHHQNMQLVDRSEPAPVVAPPVFHSAPEPLVPVANAHAQPAYGHQAYVPPPQPQATPVANLVPATPMNPMPPTYTPATPPPNEYGFTQPVPLPRPERIQISRQAPAYNPALDLERKKAAMLESGEERRRHFSSRGSIAPPTNLTNMEGAPAYARRGLQLEDAASHPDATTMSRFTLSEDQELNSNNKFLHDNVD